MVQNTLRRENKHNFNTLLCTVNQDDMRKPKYKIHGVKRRQLKNELRDLRHSANIFWQKHNREKDMSSFYGGSDTYPMSDEQAEIKCTEYKNKIEKLERDLSVLYGA